MSRSLSEVGQDLGQFGDYDVVGGQGRLGLTHTHTRLRGDVTLTHPENRQKTCMRQNLHAGAVGLAAYQSGRDVGVCELIVQVNDIRHPAGQEELIPLSHTRPEHHTVDVPPWGT